MTVQTLQSILIPNDKVEIIAFRKSDMQIGELFAGEVRDIPKFAREWVIRYVSVNPISDLLDIVVTDIP